MTTRESLIASLATIAKSHWQTKEQPVLLSNLPPLLAGNESGYKDFLGGQSLKQFIKDTETEEGSQYKLVTHPSQSAKLGLAPLPEGTDFQFPEPGATSEQAVITDRSSEKALLDFLKALKKLPAQDLVEVNIPVSVMVKMLK
jgi:hypothetical protein